jgi:hypothetical protein
VYKNFDSDTLYYYIFWINGPKKGKIQKFIVPDETKPYGKVVSVSKSKWIGKTPEQIHEKDLDNVYDTYKKLSTDEMNDFETFFNLRTKFINGDIDKSSDDYKKLLNELNRLYKEVLNGFE